MDKNRLKYTRDMNNTVKRGSHGLRFLKVLPLALLMACQFLGTKAQAAEPAQPTLDVLHNSGQTIPVTDEIYPQSEFTFTEITPADPDNLPLNVVKYYDTNAIDNNVHYYRVDLKSSVYGTGQNEKYYKWAKDEKGVKLVPTADASESVLTLKYDDSTYVDKILNASDAEIRVVDGIYVSQDIKSAIDNKGVIKSITSKFFGNTYEVTDEDTFNYSAILSEAGAKIGNISSTFVGNNISVNSSSPVYGTLVKVLGSGEIGEIKSEFIGNTVDTNSSLSGALIQINGDVGEIRSDFILNAVQSESSDIYGSVLANEGSIGSMNQTRFLANTGYSGTGTVRGGALYNADGGRINISESVFTGNSARTNSGNALGGAIFDEFSAGIVNTSFYGNYAIAGSGGTAHGGAIYTNSDLTITADNGKTTEFTGNYVINDGEKTNEAIFVEGRNHALTLNATNGGKLLINDNITGDSGFRTIFSGDDTGNIYLFGDIINSRVTANSGNVNLMNSDMKNYDWLSLTSGEDGTKFGIDLNFNNKTSDTFTLGEGSAGVVTIDKLNLIGSIPTTTTAVQILTAPDTISIAISDALKAQYAKETHGEYYDKAEDIQKLTYWDRDYMTKTQKDIVTEGIRGAVSGSGRATPDSIEYFVETEYSVLSEVKTDDTLKLVNQADIGDRTFQARQATDEYTVGADLGSTAAGELTVRGVYNDETEKWSKIHAGDHSLFELDKDGTNLILREVDITSNKDAEGAIVKATASDTSITFTGATPIDVSGVAGSDGFVNNGTMNIETEVTSNVGITGDGTLNVKKNLTLSDDASVVQNVVNVTDNSSLLLTDGAILQGDGGINIASGSTLQVTAAGLKSDVSNAGTLNLGAGTLVHNLNGAGNTVIIGDVVLDHESDSKIYTPVKLTPNTSITLNADDLQNTITRYSSDYTSAETATMVVNLTGGTLTKAIDTLAANRMVTKITGDVLLNAALNGSVVVKDGAKLTTNAGYLGGNKDYCSATTIQAGGEVHLTGGGTNGGGGTPGWIGGAGHLYINGNVYNRSHTFEPTYMTIAEGVTYYTNRLYLRSPNTVNNGTIYFYGDGSSGNTLTVPISGTGRTIFGGSNDNWVQSAIKQEIIVNSGANLLINADNIQGKITNNGGLYLNRYNSGRQLKYDVNGTGRTLIYTSLNNNWSHVDEESGETIVGVDINQPIYIYKGQTFTTNADHIGGAVTTYYNNGAGTLTLNGGTLNYNVGGAGTTNIAANSTVVSNARIASTVALNVLGGAHLTIDASNVGTDVTLSQNGTIRLGDGTIARTINGATGLTEIAGDVTLSGRRIYSPVSVMDTGTFHTPLEFLYSSINNDGNFYTHGDLDKTITGTGTTYINDEISLSGDGGIATTGTFNLNNGSLSAAGYGTEYTLGTATGTGNLSLNIDAVANKSQSFLLNEDSDGIFKLSSAWVGRTNRIAGETGIIQILKGGTVGDTDFSRLVLETESEDGKLHSWYQDKVDTYDDVAADTYYDAQFGMHTDYYTVYSSVVLATTDTPDDSIKWTVDRIDYDDSVYHGGDLLAGWNQYNAGSTEKFFRFRTENDVYKSTEVPGTQASGVENIIGVSSVNDETGEVTRSKINIGYDTKIVDNVVVETVTHREGINVGSGSTFNISNIEFLNGYKNILTSDGGKFGNIDPDTHEATGGIVNTTFDNVTIDESGTDNFEAYLVHLTDATVSQIKDSSFSNNTIKYTNSDTVYYNPSMSGAVLRLDNTKVGDTYTVEVPTYDAEGNPITDGEGNPVTTTETRYTGGIINTVIDNNYSKLTDSTANNAYRPLEIVNGSEISQIIDTKITNNTKTSSKAAAQQNFIVSNSKIHRILNLDFSGNKTISSTNGDIPGILITASSVVDLIKDSQFKNNVGPTGVTGAGSLYVNSSSVIKEMDNVTFDSNTMRNGAAIYLSAANINTIKNSEFLNNTVSQTGGAIYMGGAGKITTLKDSLFEGNKSTSISGAALQISGAAGNTMITTIDNVRFMNNTATNADSSWHYGGAIALNASTANQARIGTITNSWFEGNRVVSSNRGINGGAIGLYKSLISNITNSTFKNNSAYKSGNTYSAHGGAIYVQGSSTISNIDNVDFIENYAIQNSTSSNQHAFGGAIVNDGTITKITNSLFDGNYAQDKSTGSAVHGQGGAIYSSKTIGEISNTTFKNNKAIAGRGNGDGAAIYNAGTITTFKNNLFENNQGASVNGNSWGGAVRNTGTITNGIVNSRFLNNSVSSTNGYAAGGAITTNKSLKIIATGEDGLTEFTGNTATYKGNTYNDAISVHDNGMTLTLQADNGGHLLMNDRISGLAYIENAPESWLSYKYNAVLTGDLDSKISLFGDILGGDVTSNTGVNITTANDTPYDYHFNSWTSTNDARWTIDADFNTETSDNFTLTEASSGRVYIDYLNVLANKDDFATVQVLKTINDNIQLELNPEHINIVEDIRGSLGATVYNDEIYHQTEGYALATTDTTNDSITQLVNKDYDTLRIIGESRNNEIRNFRFRTDDEYTVTEDLTPLYSGEFTIKGTDEGSVINSDGHKLFTINKPTTFNINDVKITGTDDLIDVEDTTSVVNLHNAYIDGNINSEDVFTLNIQGDKRTTITGDVSGANVKLNAGELVIGATTFKDTTRFDADGGVIRMDNGTVEDYEMSRLTSDNAVKYNLDIDLAAQKADNITVSNTRSSGTVTVDGVNFMNGYINTTNFVTQVLKGNTDALQLALTDNVQTVRLSDISRVEVDAIKEVTGFNETYYNRIREGILWGDAYLATTENTNDSIGFNVTQDWNDYTTIRDSQGDTLKLVNQADLEERTFESYNAEDVYTLTDELGTTHEGILNITGQINGDEQSTIDLANHDGFVIGENTTLNINNTHITGSGSDDVIRVTDSSATVALNGANLDGNISGDERFNLDLSGVSTTTLNGTVNNADVSLTKGGLAFNPNTFANENTSLTTDGGYIYMNNGEVEEYTISNLSAGDKTKYAIDIDLGEKETDTIVAHGSGTISLDEFNIIGRVQNINIDDEYVIQILKTDEDDLQLQFSETVASQLDDDYHLGDNHIILSTDEIDPHTLWTDEYWQTEQDYEVWGRLALGTTDTTNDSLKLYRMRTVTGEQRIKLGDTLKLLSRADIGDREFVFEDSSNIYHLSDNLNEVATGKIDVKGVAGTDGEGNPQLSTVNMHKYSGWELDKETELNISDVKFTNLAYKNNALLKVTNANAVVNLDNVSMDPTKSSYGISNAGTINATDGDVYLTTSVTGTGTFNVTGADTVIAGNSSIIQSAVNVTDGSLTMTDGSIRGALSIGQNGTATVNTQGINHEVANEGTLNLKKDGTLIQNVTGNGTTNITANIVNGANIENDVKIKEGAEFSTARENVGGSIDNASKLNLSGTMSDVITGNGTTTAISLLNMYDGAGIVGTLNANNANISTQDSVIDNDINIGTLTGDATYSIDVLANGIQSTADKFVVGNTSSGKIILDSVNFITGSVLDSTFKAQIVDTNGTDSVYVQLSDALKEQRFMAGRTARPEEEDVNRITAYSRIYHTLERGGDLYGNLVEATTSTNNDSISIVIKDEYTIWDEDDERIETGILGDTLTLWNQLDTTEEKQFNFDQVDTYKVGENFSVEGLGETKGNKVSLNGFRDASDNLAVVDLNNKTGFELKNATEFSINNLKLTGNDTLVDVSNENAKINIDGSYIDGNITGSKNYDVAVSGTTTFNGVVTNADTTFNEGLMKFNTDTFSDADDTLTVTGDATVDLVNGTAGDTYVINELTSDAAAKWSLDVAVNNESNFTNDIIQAVSSASSGVIKLDKLNITAGGFNTIPQDMRGKEFVMQILKAQNDGIQLDLSDYVKQQQLGNTDYLLSESYVGAEDEAVKKNTQYDYEYKTTHTYLDTFGRLGLATKQTTNDSIGITINSTGNRYEYEKLDDTLYLVNNANINDRTFDFVRDDEHVDSYVVTKDLGTTATGTMSVNGIYADGTRSIINGTDSENNKHDLFKLADEQTLNLNNVQITGAKSVAQLNNTGAVLNLNNVELTGNDKGITNTSGKVNMTGSNVIANDITGAGNTEIKSGTTEFSGSTSITQTAIDVTGGSLTMADGSVNGALSVSDGASATVNVEGINHAVANEGDLTFKKDGTLNYNVTGDGTTNINGAIVNGAQISNDVKVLADAEFTTSREKVGGSIDNASKLNLTGTLSDVITGNGVTKVDSTLNLHDGAGIVGTLNSNNGTISTQDTKTSNFNIGTMTGDGTYSIDITAAGTSDKFIAGSNSSGKLTINGLNFLDNENLNPNYKVQVIDSASEGNLYLALSDEVKAKKYDAGRTSRDETDNVNAITAYTDLYHNYVRGGDLKGTLVEATTATNKDSIGIEVKDEYTVWDADRTENGLKGDTLALWNTLDTTEDKQFTFNSAATYKVGQNYDVAGVGDTKGTNVSITGVSTSETVKSTVDLNNKTGFNIVDATNFTLDNVKLTGNNTLVTVANEDAAITVKDSYVDGNINGTEKFAMEVQGTGVSTINGAVTNADTTLTSGTIKFNTNTFADTNDTLTTTSAANVNLSNGTAGDEYAINKLTSSTDAKWTIDVDVTNQLADKIKIATADSSGKVLLDKLNVTNGSFDDIPEDMRGQEFIVQILKAQNSDIQLDLSDYVKQQLGDKNYLIGIGSETSEDEEVKQHTQYDYEYKHTETWGDIYGKLRLAKSDTENDSIGIVYDHTEGREVITKLDDTLKLVNQANIEDRTFDFVRDDTHVDNYVVTTDLGTTATGTMSVNGVFADGQRSTINGTDTEGVAHDLFKLADAQTLNLNNVQIIGAKSVAELSDDAAILNLNNVEIANNQKGITNTFGTVNLTGTNIIANNITGAGDTNLKSGSTTNKATIEQTTFTIEDAAAKLVNEGVIKAAFDNSVGSDVENENSIIANGGSNAGNITGDGTFENTKDNTFVNDGTITQATVTNDGTWTNNNDIIATITNKSNGEMTSNADNLKGTVTNSGLVTLTGGTTQNNFGGASTGTIEVTGDLTVNKTISGNELKLTNGVTQLTTEGSISGAKQLTANGGALSVMDDIVGDSPIDMGKVVLNKNLDVYIDANLAQEKADVLSASKGVDQRTDASGNKNHILLNRVNILNDAVEKMSMYVDVVDDTLRDKDYVALGTQVEAQVINSKGGKDSFLVTYDDSRGQLLVEYSTLPVAVSSDTKTKVYAMNDDETVGDLGELHGDSLSISGNGNSITGAGDSEGITVNKDQTLSVNNVDEYSGFDTAIDNKGGTVNVRNTDFTNNTTDIANNKDSDGNGGNLLLEGEDNIDSITGDGTTKISSYTTDTTTVNADVTVNNTLEQSEVDIDKNNTLTTKGTTDVDTLNNEGTYNNEGTATINDAVDNTGVINNGSENTNAVLNLNGNDMNVGGTLNNAQGSDVTIDGTGTTKLAAETNNNGNLNINSDTDITGNIKGDNGKTDINADTTVKASVEQNTVNNTANVTVDDSKGSIKTSGEITNTGTLTSKANNLTAGGGIDNSGNLNLTGGNNKNTITGEDGTTTFSGTSSNSADITQKSVENNGTLNNNSTINVSDGLKNNSGAKLTNNGDINGDVENASNGVIANNSKINGAVDNSGTFANNGTISGDITNNESGKLTNNSKIDTTLVNDGKVVNNGVISGPVENNPNGEISTKIAGLTGDSINNDGTIKYTDSGSTIVDIKGNGRVELRNNNNGVVALNNDLDNNTLALYNGTLIFDKQKTVAGFEANGGNVNAMNNKIDSINLGNVVINNKTGLTLDFRLDDEVSDKFLNSGVAKNGGSINVTGVNIVGTTLKDYVRVHLGDTTTLGRANVTSDTFDLPSILTPIRYLHGRVSGGWLTYQGSGNQYKDFNPAIMASSVAQQVGGFMTQSQTLQDSFFHMNRYSKYPNSQRLIAENGNKIALENGTPVFEKSHIPETSQAMWTKPYSTFEKVELKNGPKVSNFAYGTLYGGDTDLVDIGHGFKGVLSAFIGYNGNHMSYDGISMDQQGGTFGITGTAYKGNFFTGITVSAGASAGEAHTMYGTDHFAMFTSGIANKTGYNIELNEGKIIIQPSLYTGYTFVNTFDYKNAANVKLDSDTLNAIQLIPGLKIIGNTKTGWQPYASIDMVWNIYAGGNHVTAANSKLPQLSVKPYVQYGVGIQKSWADRFTGFFEAMVRNSGRTGVSLQAGFRWNIGDKSGNNKSQNVKNVSDKKVIKSIDKKNK